jgi:dihydroflavonol-4-reductase
MELITSDRRGRVAAGDITLITGATGFLGAHLVAELVRRGAGALRVMQTGRAPAWLEEPALGIEVVRGSVTSASDLAAAMKGVARVYHLAGLVSHKAEDARRMYAVHVDGTRLLCQAAVDAGVQRIVLSSTSGTIAVSRRADADLDEDSPPPIDIIGRWPYYTSKLYQEEVARRACGARVELVMVNPSLLLGPGDDRLSSTRLVLQYLGREIPMSPSGGVNFVDVRDVARVLPIAMEQGAAGARYLLGGANYSFDELFGRLERMTKVPGPWVKGRGRIPWLASRAQAAVYRQLGRTPPVEPAAVDMAGHFWYFESRKAIVELGFAAREATETLLDTVRYLRVNFLGTPGHGEPSSVLEGVSALAASSAASSDRLTTAAPPD